METDHRAACQYCAQALVGALISSRQDAMVSIQSVEEDAKASLETVQLVLHLLKLCWRSCSARGEGGSDSPRKRAEHHQVPNGHWGSHLRQGSKSQKLLSSRQYAALWVLLRSL